MTTWRRWWSTFPVIWGRVIMPMALMSAWWAAVMGLSILTDRGLGTLMQGAIGEIIGAVSTAAAVLLIAGWWIRSITWLRHGLMLTACVSGATTATLFAEFGPLNVSAWLATPWLIGCGLAWLIEVRDAHSGRP